MRLCELQEEREAVVTFSHGVTSLFNSRNVRFHDVFNTLVTRYTTDLTTTTDIWPKVSRLRQVQEATLAHADRITNTRPKLLPSHLDPFTARYSQPQKGAQSTSGTGVTWSSGTWGPRHVYDFAAFKSVSGCWYLGRVRVGSLYFRWQPGMSVWFFSLYVFLFQIKFAFVLSDYWHVLRQRRRHMCHFGGRLCPSYLFGLEFNTVLVCTLHVTSGLPRIFGHIYNDPPIHILPTNCNLLK